jgi:ABC-type multidrug transport system ATPase subunit
MTPREILELAARLLGLVPADARRRIDRAIAWVRLPKDAVDAPVRRGGPPNLQRTGLAAALIGDPEVLLLDEPLRAIDADERARILTLPGRRRTILLASRYPASETGLVNHVALLRAGRVALIASVADLDEAGLPISLKGIGELADRRAGDLESGSGVVAAGGR